MPSKRIVVITEGQGDVDAAPTLITKILRGRTDNPWTDVTVDPDPIRIGGLQNISGSPAQQAIWLKRLGIAARRRNMGAALLMLDGDSKFFERDPFCQVLAAKSLAMRAKEVRAGEKFSLAIVFACKEYESWLIAGIESLSGVLINDRPGVRANAKTPPFAIEDRRDAKGWLSEQMINGYKQSTDQLPLTEKVDLDIIRQKRLRSFRRLEHAIDQLVAGVRTGQHCITPL